MCNGDASRPECRNHGFKVCGPDHGKVRGQQQGASVAAQGCRADAQLKSRTLSGSGIDEWPSPLGYPACGARDYDGFGDRWRLLDRRQQLLQHGVDKLQSRLHR
jgi:hypothetical protein